MISRIRTAKKVSVTRACSLLKMTTQNFYSRKRIRKKKDLDEQFIISLVLKERKLQKRIGSDKLLYMLRPELVEHGVQIGRDLFIELLRQHNLLIRKKKRSVKTTDSYHGLPVFHNLIDKLEITAPHQVLVSDITYINVEDSFMYASLITDRYSRKIVGAYLGDTLESVGCQVALKQAIKQLPVGANPIHHSDRGCQYCCHDYVEMLNNRNIKISMTEKYHCYENAVAERVNGILKDEYGLDAYFKTKEQAVKAFYQAIELYNGRRPHLALDYATPTEVHNVGKEGYIIPPPMLLKEVA